MFTYLGFYLREQLCDVGVRGFKFFLDFMCGVEEEFKIKRGLNQGKMFEGVKYFY